MKHLTRSRAKAVVLAAALVATGAPVSLFAQQVEEILVTARQRSEKLTDVPASITAFTEDTIERVGVERAEDFIALTPGVTMVNTAEVGDTNVSIRGLNGARDAETNFAFIVDGILYTNPSAFNREYTDLRQIEVLKGPQGAAYGRSAASGAVIVTTGKPSNEFEGNVEASLASHDTAMVKGMISGPLVSDTLYGRISIDYRDTDGHLTNNFTDTRIVNDFENYNVTGRLVWEPSDALAIDSKLRYGEVEAASIAFNASFALPSFVAFIGPDAFEDANDHQFVFSPNVDPENEQETLEASIKVDYDMDWATLTSWALYSDVEQFFSADGTSGAFGFYFADPTCLATTAALQGFPVQTPTFIGADPGTSLYPPYSPTTCDGYQFQVRDQEDLSLEVRLTSSDDQRLRWNVGAYWLDLEREVGVAQLFDDGSGNLPASLINSYTDALVRDQFDTTVYSLFGGINYDLTDAVEASVALRWDQEERDVTNLVPTPSQRTSTRIDYCAAIGGCTLNGVPLVGSPLNPAFVTNFATGETVDAIAPRSKTFSQLQPKVSLTWDLGDDWTLFGSWGIGFKSGGFNNLGSNATTQLFFVDAGATLVAPPDLFRKEKSSAFEVGFKADIADGRVQLNGAAFHTEVDDMQFFEFFVGPFGLLRVVENIDEVTIQGLEAAVSAQITDGISLSAGASWIDGEIDENAIRPNTVGNEVPNAPEYTFNASAQYVSPEFSGMNFVGNVTFSRVGETSFHTVQDNVVPATLFGGPPADFSRTRRDAYDIVNLRLGLEGEQWRATAFANNLFDEEYLAEVITAPEFGGSFVHPGTDRVYGLEVAFSFQ